MRPLFDSWAGKIPWKRDRLPTPVLMGFPGGSEGIESVCNVGDLGSIPGLGRSPGGHGNPLQQSCLENPHGQRILVATVHGVPKRSDMTEWLSTCPTAPPASDSSQRRHQQTGIILIFMPILDSLNGYLLMSILCTFMHWELSGHLRGIKPSLSVTQVHLPLASNWSRPRGSPLVWQFSVSLVFSCFFPELPSLPLLAPSP